MKEKRKAPRINEKAAVTISLAGLDYPHLDKKITHCLTEDISIKGIKIQSEKFLPINSILKIQLSLREPTRLINVLGKVRWIKKLKACEVFEMGIEIVETSREDMGVLKRHIEELPGMIKEKNCSWKTNS
jgi:predicted nucleotide-binding protein (sugar kinase/HSP70/actin superfamily)